MLNHDFWLVIFEFRGCVVALALGNYGQSTSWTMGFWMILRYLGVSINGEPPIGWFIMENPIKNGWFGGTPISGTPPCRFRMFQFHGKPWNYMGDFAPSGRWSKGLSEELWLLRRFMSCFEPLRDSFFEFARVDNSRQFRERHIFITTSSLCP